MNFPIADFENLSSRVLISFLPSVVHLHDLGGMSLHFYRGLTQIVSRYNLLLSKVLSLIDSHVSRAYSHTDPTS